LDLQLPVQSVPIATKVVSLNPVHDEVYSVVLCFSKNKNSVTKSYRKKLTDMKDAKNK
jgi:hypothetical protein